MTATVEQIPVPGENGSQWYVFRTRPRCEKKAAELFGDMGLRHYLPLRDKVTRKGRRTFSTRLPLFSGYMFGCCDVGSRLQAMQSGHQAQWLR